MIKNNSPDSKKIEELLAGEKFDHYFPDGQHKGNNNRRDSGREDEYKGNHQNNKKLHADDSNIAGLINAMQRSIAASIDRNPSLADRIDVSVLSVNPTAVGREYLRSLLTKISAAQSVVKSQESEEQGEKTSLLGSLIDKCKSWILGRKKCCHNGHVAGKTPVVDKALGKAITNVAMQELGELTPLMLNNIANIDHKFIVDPENPNRRKTQERTVIV